MSVSSGIVNTYVVPIFRVPEKPVFNPSILARWHATAEVTGDGTGGAYVFSFVFQNIQGMLGQHSLWDIRFLNIQPLGALAAGGCYWTVTTYERSTGGSTVPLRYYHNQGSNYALASEQIPIDYKFRFTDFPTLPTQIQGICEPNTNLVVVQARVGGYIYDERYI